jgi:peptidoglycan/xylan/chitin deacetylase (PgdA/CDA1 family)
MNYCDDVHRSMSNLTRQPVSRSGWLALILLAVVSSLCSAVFDGASALAADTGDAPPPDKVIYLTFDDGPSAYTQEILDILAEHDAKATFFVLGSRAASQPDLIEAIYNGGNGLANHTYNHPSLPTVGFPRYQAEVIATGAALGGRDGGCLRPPYGATNKSVYTGAERLGYRVVLWTVDPRDWSRPGASAIASRVFQRATPGAVVVLHDGGGERSQTVAALRTILQQLGAQGYRFAALCRGDAPLPESLARSSKPFSGGSTGSAVPVSVVPAPTFDPAVPNGIASPHADAHVSGVVAIVGTAAHPSFRKWQLDLLLDGAGETFLALGAEPQATPGELTQWDTTRYPNGSHVLRLRVVREALNYDEFFVPVVIEN